MVLPDSHRISRVLWYSGYPQSQLKFRVRAYHPVSELFPEHFRYPCWSLYEGPTTPNRRIYSVWPSPVSLATTAGVSFDFFSMPGTLPIVYSVPVISHLLPNASPAAFTAFANCKVGRMRDTYRGSFVPRAYSDTA